MVVRMSDLNREAALDLAEKQDFDPEEMLYCTECGRTVVRTQKAGNPGFPDKIYCTCDSVGYPMTPVADQGGGSDD